MKILIVEDEERLSKNIFDYLRSANYVCDIAESFRAALSMIGGCDYDCILLDIDLPDGNGLQLLEQLRKAHRPDGVVLISNRCSVNDKIAGLDLGADDYLTKPFNLSELSARIAAVIRRRKFNDEIKITINDLIIDTNARAVSCNGRKIDLTRKEFELLLYLAVNKNRVISKYAIAEHLTGNNVEYFDNFDFIYAHFKNLKKKVCSAGAAHNIKTIYGVGYLLVSND